MGQSALILLAILPYLILRYFFGGMQLFAELSPHALSSSSSPGPSPPSRSASPRWVRPLIRGLVVVAGSVRPRGLHLRSGLLLNLSSFIDALSFTSQRTTALPPSASSRWRSMPAISSSRLGATAIAPAAENRSTRKRLIGLGIVLADLPPPQVRRPRTEPSSPPSSSAGLISLDLFTESRRLSRASSASPFLRFGQPRAPSSDASSIPGHWASGTLFFLVMPPCWWSSGSVALHAPTGPLRHCANGSTHHWRLASGSCSSRPLSSSSLAANSENRFSVLSSPSSIMSFLLTVFILTILFVKWSAHEAPLCGSSSPIPMVFFPRRRRSVRLPQANSTRPSLRRPGASPGLLPPHRPSLGAIPKVRAIGDLERSAEEELAAMEAESG